MKAIVYYGYGSPDILRCEEMAEPSVGDDDVLLRVRAASVNPMDWRLMRGLPLGKPKMSEMSRPGRDVAGQVEAVGRNVTRIKTGDEVFGTCRGAFAEYACASEPELALKPANVTFEQAASVPVAGVTALQGLRDKGRIQAGQTVLINGAAGGVGTYAVQIAKSFGAEVTGVCSTRNVEMVRSIGADRVIDYTQEDFTKSDQRYDVIFDCVGNHAPSACRRVLHPRGRWVMAGAPRELRTFLTRVLKALMLSPFVSQSFVLLLAQGSREDLVILGDLLAAGKVTPVIDRSYRLSEVPDAIWYLEEGHARGKVVITV